MAETKEWEGHDAALWLVPPKLVRERLLWWRILWATFALGE